MARNRNVENPVRSATLRKWYARAWWVGVHVYGYVVLGVKGALSPQALPTGQFVVYLVVAVAAISCYVVLQCSSPGQLDKRPMLAPVQTTTPTELGSSPRMATEDDDDTELLGDGEENEHQGSSTDLHFCNECHVFQPLRTKHCKDCARCTRQYDHHCDCVGTCVGENNRRLFVLYLFLQILEGAAMIDVTSEAFTEQDDVNDWFKANAHTSSRRTRPHGNMPAARLSPTCKICRTNALHSTAAFYKTGGSSSPMVTATNGFIKV
ncbi:hypothetical protein, variant 1 [Phytophthora nicotianae P1976]|uniref:Palmitoyltransferase n=1 Tax=Phytophthora nicotianae P1976 TaxID=1317066 RepID=A0A080Z365_PHYNI|nr:hypothetical protein, variant 1 [Phytophthora nicotianae P1976]